MKRILSLACVVVAVSLEISLAGCGAAAQGKEQRFSWPRWGGPEGNWISRETDWYPEALNGEKPVAWIADIGYGYSNIAVQQNRLYALGCGGGNQWVICLDALTGRQLWKYTYTLRGLNPQSTPSIDGDTVFTLSDDGLVLCLDARRGKVIWSRNLVEEYHVLRPRYGFSASPVVEGDRLLITCNSYGIALDTSTGDVVWLSPAEDANGDGCSLIDAYATSVVFSHGQSRSMVQFDDYGVYEVEIATGTPHWFFPWPDASNNTRWANVANPLVFADRLFISTSSAVGCALLDIGSGNPRVIWSNRNLCADIATPILLDGYLFGCHDAKPFASWGIAGTLRCLNFRNGEVVWEEDLGAPVTLAAAGNKLLLLSERGMLSVVEASPRGYQLISECDLLQGESRTAKFWTPPVLCNGLIYCRNYTGALFCLNVGK